MKGGQASNKLGLTIDGASNFSLLTVPSGVTAAAIGSEVTSRRPFVVISIPQANQKPQTITALYDTGAGCSCISLRTLALLKKNNRVIKEIKDHSVTLANASGDAMATRGAFQVKLSILGKEVLVNCIAVDRMADEMILGMNAIQDLGLTFDPIQFSVSFGHGKRRKQGTWTQAEVYPVSVVKIEPSQVALVKCRARTPEGDLVRGVQDIVVDIAGKSTVVTTNDYGVFQTLVPNLSPDQPVELQRLNKIGDALNVTEFVNVGVSAETMNNLVMAEEAGYAKYVSATMVMDEQVGPTTGVYDLIQDATRHLQFPYKEKMRELLWKHRNIISKSKTDLGKAKPTQYSAANTEHTIELQDNEPVFRKQFPLTNEEFDLIKLNLHEWLKQDTVERAKSPYNAPIFTVKKKEGHGLRLVLDYRGVNAKTLKDRYSIKTVDQCIAQVGRAGSKIFSVIDLTSAFWQVPLRASDRRITAFTIPGIGQFQWKATPMGLTGAPATFARYMDHLMGGLLNVITYIDDILCHSKDLDAHLKHLDEVFTRISLAGLKINVAKCEFGVETVQYLGHSLTPSGIRPGLDKTKAIADAQMPRELKDLRSFLGLINYFRQYIKNFSQKAAPLYNLTKNTATWRRGRLPEEAVEAFEALKKELVSAPLLAFPNQKGTFHLFVDSATGDSFGKSGGLGACLAQEQPDGTIKPVAYANRRLKGHEQNYSAFLAEMAAACYGMEYFQDYLRGRQFMLYTDHKPLEKLSAAHTKTLNRFQECARDFTFSTHYIKGAHTPADFLSRCCLSSIIPISAVEPSETVLKALYEEDPLCMLFIRYLDNTLRPDDKDHPLFPYLGRSQGLLYVKLPPRKGVVDFYPYKWIAPKRLQQRLIQEAHNSTIGGHSGIYKTMERIRDKWFWPSMQEDVKTHLRQCTACQRNTNKGRAQPLPLLPLPTPTAPNARVHVDLFGPLSDGDNDNKRVVVMTDAFTKLVALAVVPDKSAPQVANAIWNRWIAYYGTPKEIVSDQGLEFAAKLTTEIWRKMGIDHSMTTPYHPQSNAQAEVFNKTMAHYLRTVIDESQASNLNWELYIAPLQMSHNTAVHKATKTTPFYTMFGYDPRMPLWKEGQVLGFEEIALKSEQELASDPTVLLRTTQDKMRKLAHHNNQEYRDAYSRNYERANPKAAIPQFFTGDLVWVVINGKSGKNQKLSPSWEPAVVLAPSSTHTVRVRRLNRKRKPLVTLNLSQVKKNLTQEEFPEDLPKTHTVEDEDCDNPDDHTEGDDTNVDGQEVDNQSSYSGPRTRARSRLQANLVRAVDTKGTLDGLEARLGLEEALEVAARAGGHLTDALLQRLLYRGWRGATIRLGQSGTDRYQPPRQDQGVNGHDDEEDTPQDEVGEDNVSGYEEETDGQSPASHSEHAADMTDTPGANTTPTQGRYNPFLGLFGSGRQNKEKPHPGSSGTGRISKPSRFSRVKKRLANFNSPGTKTWTQDDEPNVRKLRSGATQKLGAISARRADPRMAYQRPPGKPTSHWVRTAYQHPPGTPTADWVQLWHQVQEEVWQTAGKGLAVASI